MKPSTVRESDILADGMRKGSICCREPLLSPSAMPTQANVSCRLGHDEPEDESERQRNMLIIIARKNLRLTSLSHPAHHTKRQILSEDLEKEKGKKEEEEVGGYQKVSLRNTLKATSRYPAYLLECPLRGLFRLAERQGSM